MSPGGVMVCSPDWPPKIMMLRQMRPGLAGIARTLVPSARRRPTRMSTMPFSPNVRNRFARARVDLLQKAVDREDQPAVLAVGALPVVDALARDAAQTVVYPDLLAGRRVERDERGPVAPEAVEHVMSEHGTEDRRAVRIEPGHLELTDVGLLDLIERVEIRALERWQRLGLSLGGRHGERDHEQKCDGKRTGRPRPTPSRGQGACCAGARGWPGAGGCLGFFNEMDQS